MTSFPANTRVLVLGAGRGQTRLIHAFRALGIPVYVATQMRDDLPGIRLADHIVEVDIRDAKAVADKAHALGITAVATSCMDTAMHTLGYLVDELGLRGVSYDAAQLCNNKIAMKKRLEEHHVPTAPFAIISSEDELHAALAEIGFPAVIKAPDLQGSNGVYIVDSVEEAEHAFTTIMTMSRSSEILVEKFIDGIEFGAQAFVHNGEVLFVLPHSDALVETGLPIPVEHSVPFAYADECGDLCRQVVTDAIGALGLDYCAVNVDMFYQDGQVFIIELTGRVGANGLPEMTEAALGLDYMELVAREALDFDVIDYWNTRAPQYSHVIARMIARPDLHGTVAELSCEDVNAGWLIDRRMFITNGAELDGFSSSNDCLGQVIVASESEESARERLNTAINTIHIAVN